VSPLEIIFFVEMPSVSLLVRNTEILLLAERAVFFVALKTLIISDVHLGKINHFRKAGIAVPVAANQVNLETMVKLLMEFQPKRVIFIGDLFHSHYNAEWEALGPIIRNFSSCSFELVPGNHDIMSALQYQRHQILVHPLELSLTPEILLTHEPQEKPRQSYIICGHVHPAVSLSGKGRQSLTLPCFWFGKHQAILPAFGVFTGMLPVKPNSGDRVFAVMKNEVVDVSLSPVEKNANRKLKSG
jgi:uncharacterized protein